MANTRPTAPAPPRAARDTPRDPRPRGRPAAARPAVIDFARTAPAVGAHGRVAISSGGARHTTRVVVSRVEPERFYVLLCGAPVALALPSGVGRLPTGTVCAWLWELGA